MKLTDEQINDMAKSLREGYLSEMKEALDGENQYEGPDDESYSEDFGIWLDSPHPEVPEYEKWYTSDNSLDDDYNRIHKAALPPYDEFVSYISSKEDTSDNPDESSDKPHDNKLATSNALAGDLTPEEIEMIQMMRAGKQPSKNDGLAGETTPEEKEMLNITNRLAKNLSKHRW